MADRDTSRDRGSNGGGGGALSHEFQSLVSALAERAVSGATDRVGGLTDKLTDFAENGSTKAKTVAKAGEEVAEGKGPLRTALSTGVEGVKDKVSEAFGGGKGGGSGGKKLKVTNIVEQIDVGAPVRVVYNQWTQFQDYSNFMKKVEDVDQKEEQKLTFKAQVLWSHRTWESTIVEQVPDKHIVWESKGEKGRVDGAVTFHRLAENLTRVLVVLEYHPQGLFERTGNLWRAQGRRVRLELKNFRRHVMREVLLHPDDTEGWRGEIHDREVTKSHEEAVDEEGSAEDDEAEDEYDEDAEDSDADDEYEDEEDDEDADAEDEYEDDDEDEEDDEDADADDEYEDEDEDDEDADADDEYDDDEDDEYDEDADADDEYDDDEDDEPDEAPRRGRSRAGAGRR